MKKVLDVLSKALVVLKILKNKTFLKSLAALIVAVGAIFGVNFEVTDQTLDTVVEVVTVADNVGSSLLPDDMNEIADIPEADAEAEE
jgi:hypothetical protein